MEQTILKDILLRLDKIEDQTNGGMDKRLTILETKSIERWDSHDKRAKDLKESILLKMNELSKQIVEVKVKFDTMPCAKHVKEIEQNARFREGASKALWIIFAAIIGLGIKVVFMG